MSKRTTQYTGSLWVLKKPTFGPIQTSFYLFLDRHQESHLLSRTDNF